MSDDTNLDTPTPPNPGDLQAPADGLEAVAVDDDDERDGPGAIQEPGKLLRIALMLREMQEEARRAGTDEGGRGRLRFVHERAIEALCESLSGSLRDELASFTLPFEDDTPSEPEILIAQAQLIGWLEGLFQGIQAAIVNQQLQARQQLEQMRQRGLPPGMMPGGRPGLPGAPMPGPQGQPPAGQRPSDGSRGTGQYL